MASLWASETPIYGRFGYGVATRFFRTSLDRNRVVFPRQALGSGSIRILDAEGAKGVLPEF